MPKVKLIKKFKLSSGKARGGVIARLWQRRATQPGGNLGFFMYHYFGSTTLADDCPFDMALATRNPLSMLNSCNFEKVCSARFRTVG